jgi:hypothetical protein
MILIKHLIRLLCISLIIPIICNAQTNNTSRGTGIYLASGITLSSLGGIAIAFSIPCFVSAAKVDPRNASLTGLSGGFGVTALCTGLILEGLSVPFYIKYNKIKKAKNIKVTIANNGVDLTVNF